MPKNTITPYLHERGYRITPQRLIVLEILEQAGEHLSPGEIVREACQRMPGINEATVYRTLEFLCEQGLAHRAYLDGNQVHYEIAHLHHHLICRQCGIEHELDHLVLEDTYAKIEKISGFTLNTSHIIFYGTCPECKTNPALS